MPRIWNLVGFLCIASLLVGCGSTPQKKRDAGADGASADTAPDGGDSPPADAPVGDAAEAGEAGEVSGDTVAGEVADVPKVDAEVGTPEAAVDVPVVPDVPAEMPVDRPITGLPNGAPCSVNSMCRTNFCVDAVCCENACNNGCSACLMAKTGRPDGMCLADRNKERMDCGTYCAQIGAQVPAVLKKVCTAGQCVQSSTIMIQEICQKEDKCTVSFCDQPTPTMARCVHTVCPTAGTCCCGAAGNTTNRMCVQRTACSGDRSCS